MTKTFRNSLLPGLILFLIPTLQARICNPQTDAGLAISVRVYNYAEVPHSVLDRAQQETSHILREAGVDTRWVTCALTADDLDKYPECNRRRTPADLVLAIVPRDMAKRMFGQHDVFGVAASSETGFGHRASIFHHRIEELSQRWQASEPLLLGHFIAHELGHLLLGSNSHSDSGIMHVPWTQAHLQQAQTASLLFTAKEAKRIRRQLRNRVEAE